jgi:RNA polymerase-binding transcription factor DksA
VKKAKPAVKKPKPAVKKAKPAVKKATGKAPKTKGKKVAAKKPAARKAAPQKIARKPVVSKAAKKPAVKKAIQKKAAAKVTKKPAVKKPTAQKIAKTPAAQKAAQKPAQETAAPQEEPERRACGFYDGVLVCERPRLLPKATPYTETEVESLRNILLRERTRLREVLRDLDQLTFNIGEETSGAVPGYSIHLAEDATNNIDTETALMLRRDEEEGLMHVEAALDRLETSLFGVCVACGCRIGMNRLKVVPETHLCMECKTIYDRKSANR